jgi:hypothetical protein
MSDIVQIEPKPWPSGYGDVIAILDVALDRLADRYSLRLFEGADNLASYRAAAVVLPSGRQIGFLLHDGEPSGSTEIHADVKDDPRVVIRELLQALSLPETAVSWLRDAANPKQLPEPMSAHAR